MSEPQPALFPASEIPALPPGMPKIGPARPSCRDPILIKMAAKQMALTLCESGAMGPGEHDIDGMADDLAACPSWHRDDGYKFASYLDHHHHWDCDFAIAEHLDDFSYVLDRVVTDAERLWAAENNIQPPFPNGTRVRFGAETGIIDKVYKHGVARYAIAVDGDPDAHGAKHSRRIVKFEDVTAVEGEGATPTPGTVA